VIWKKSEKTIRHFSKAFASPNVLILKLPRDCRDYDSTNVGTANNFATCYKKASRMPSPFRLPNLKTWSNRNKPGWPKKKRLGLRGVGPRGRPQENLTRGQSGSRAASMNGPRTNCQTANYTGLIYRLSQLPLTIWFRGFQSGNEPIVRANILVPFLLPER
jgi:hypothetical protein